MNFFDIKHFLARYPYLFNFTKRYFNMAKSLVSYRKRREKAQDKLREIEHAHLLAHDVIWYCCVAIHPNLGDLGQTICTLDWLKKNYSGASIVEIPDRDFYFDSTRMLSVMRQSVMKDDLIIFQSGYTMTGVHDDEPFRQAILNAFPDNRIVLLPQTILYQREELKSSAIETYKDRKNLLLLIRDSASYETAKSLFGYTQMVLFPDIVTTWIGTKKFEYKRAGVLFCVRDDWERLYSKKDMADLMRRIEKHECVSQTDTTMHISNTEDREKVREIIEQTIAEYSRYKLIVTDRYHGIIFSLVAKTPVVVLKSTDHKVITGAEWFVPYMQDNIAVVDALEQAEEIILKMLNKPHVFEDEPYFQKKYYNKLKSLIEKHSCPGEIS